MDKFLIIDGNSIINRAFYALPLLNNQFGEYSNAVYGFTNILIKAILEYQPKYIAVAFDFGKKTFRNEIYENYKGTRKGMPNELAEQMPILKSLLSKMKISFFEMEKIEADDIIGTLSRAENVEKIILSGDRDLFQLIDSTTNIYFTKKGITDVEKFDKEKLLQFMGLTPNQIVEYKALCGDASDNIPGVAGIGNKSALALLEQFDNVDNIYANLNEISKASIKQKLIDGKDMAYISKQLATIKRDVDLKYNLEDLTYDFPFNNEVYDFFVRYDFKSLLKRRDIFAENIKNNIKEVEYEAVKIEDLSHLKKVIEYIKESKTIAFDFNDNLKFACSANFEYGFEKQITMFSSSISIEDALNELKPIFEDDNILKICYDLKKHKHLLSQISISQNAFDIAIARYVLAKNTKNNDLNSPVLYFEEYKNLNNEMEKFGVLNIFKNIDMPLVEVLYNMEKDGLLIDICQANEVKQSLAIELDCLTNKIYELAGEKFKINSPKALGEILFDKMGISTANNRKKSTSVEILSQIEDKYEIVSFVLRYRKVQKLLTTYVEPFSLLAQQNNGYIHTTFSQILTSTGRLSSSDPNLQNLPIRDEDGKHLRKFFISRFAGGNLVSADYNQVELRLMAHYSQDSNLIDAYKHGQDIHSSTASLIFDKPIEEITPNERRVAKTVNFGIIYGISEFGLSQNLNISILKAKNYIERYFYSYPNVKKYMQDCVALAKETGYVKTLFGRMRYIPELLSTNKSVVKFGERVAINMPLQGTASDIIKIAMIRTFYRFKQEKLQAKLVLQIHDELIVDCPANETDTVIKILNEEMTGVIKLSVDLPVEISFGKTLMDC